MGRIGRKTMISWSKVGLTADIGAKKNWKEDDGMVDVILEDLWEKAYLVLEMYLLTESNVFDPIGSHVNLKVTIFLNMDFCVLFLKDVQLCCDTGSSRLFDENKKKVEVKLYYVIYFVITLSSCRVAYGFAHSFVVIDRTIGYIHGASAIGVAYGFAHSFVVIDRTIGYIHGYPLCSSTPAPRIGSLRPIREPSCSGNNSVDLLSAVESWPLAIYSALPVIAAIDPQLNTSSMTNQLKEVRASKYGCHVYAIEQYEKAFALYADLSGHSKSSVPVVQLMVIDHKRVVSLLITDLITPVEVVSQLLAAKKECDSRYTFSFMLQDGTPVNFLAIARNFQDLMHMLFDVEFT
ncbi:vacuolar sorting protein [Artemisia annua]|uniref:Vacuolar sorting protein n=1 Tax=Artemisia annua TaxID=35608 RepID=A0A2U1N2I2_ARTAN|nr:vacuolar sorting protein [Artemisia annua]